MVWGDLFMQQIPYNRGAAVEYARKWAFQRNPRYYNFDSVGGDCTNFISQCIYAGCGVMNYTRDTGWYYSSQSNRAAGWSGVPYLYKFLTSNRGPGPYASPVPQALMEPGDVIQLGRNDGTWYHSLLVVENTGNDILVATHTYDAFGRTLSGYTRERTRFLHIEGCRK